MTSALQDCDSTATKRREGGRLRAIGAGLLLAAALLPAAGADAQPTVATTSGTFTGVPSPSAAGIDVFFGIRYAASPAGAAPQRFRTFPLSPRNGKVRPFKQSVVAGNRDGGKCRIAQGRKIGSDGRSQDEMLEQDGAWRLRLCKIAP
jgi:hypothetical protein